MVFCLESALMNSIESTVRIVVVQAEIKLAHNTLAFPPAPALYPELTGRDQIREVPSVQNLFFRKLW